MKSLILFFFVLQFLCSAQEEDKKIKLEKYIEFIDDYELNNHAELESLSTEEFNQLIKIAYEAIEVSSLELTKITQSNVNYRNANSSILRQVEAKYSYIIETLVRIPIFVKAKILSSEEVHKNKFCQFNLKLKPEYFVKGSNAFQTEEEFEVYYRKYEYVSDSVDYKIGKSYLFPLWDRGEPDNQFYAIATWISGEDSRFLIENEVLYDENNYFNMENKVNWNDFVERMRDMINLILNEEELEKYKMPSIYRRGR